MVLRAVSLLALFPLVAGRTNYFVDESNGSDDNKGTKNKPFRSLSKATSVLDAGDALYLREGSYKLNDTVSIAGLDASASSATTLISGYGDEQVSLDGTVDLTDTLEWTLSAGSETIWVASVPTGLRPLQLFVDDAMMVLSRFPNAFWGNKTVREIPVPTVSCVNCSLLAPRLRSLKPLWLYRTLRTPAPTTLAPVKQHWWTREGWRRAE